jgi:hypothetical protein
VTTGQCSDRRCSGGLRVDCLKKKLQQCECRCVVLLCCVVLCCGVVWCGVVWCGVVWCVVFTVFTHDYVGEVQLQWLRAGARQLRLTEGYTLPK